MNGIQKSTAMDVCSSLKIDAFHRSRRRRQPPNTPCPKPERAASVPPDCVQLSYHPPVIFLLFQPLISAFLGCCLSSASHPCLIKEAGVNSQDPAYITIGHHMGFFFFDILHRAAGCSVILWSFRLDGHKEKAESLTGPTPGHRRARRRHRLNRELCSAPNKY